MLKKQHIPVLIFVTFCFFLREYLSSATLLLAGLGSICVVAKIRVSRLNRTLIVLSIFASYWLIYGKVIDPEVGLNFLTSVIMLKMLERDSRRDDYMIFFGLILLLSCGTLFEKNLTYVFYFTLSFVGLLSHFYTEIKVKLRFKDLILSFLWVMPLTVALFFFAPRIISPLPFNLKSPGQGKVGYTPDLNLSELEEVSSNDEPVFQAQVQKISSDELYWRGNILSANDGWNWTSFRTTVGTIIGELPEQKNAKRQLIRLRGRDEYLFALDRPLAFGFDGRMAIPDDSGSFSQRSSSFTSEYVVYSDLQPVQASSQKDRDLRVVLSQMDKNWILQTFAGSNVTEISESVRNYIQQNDFSYSYAPGRIQSFRQFMQKKIGLCSHYASALGIILRTKGIPSRLVSGFMGGTYNPYAGFYQITQNDAHTWVEALENDHWKRIDPTAWIAPDRISLGGEAFVASRSDVKGGANLKFRLAFGWFQDAKLWFDQWDYRFYGWLDQMDYYGQSGMLAKLKIHRKWLYWIIPVLILGFALIYFIQLKWFFLPDQTPELHLLWQDFHRKSSKRGLKLGLRSVSAMEEGIRSFQHKDAGLLLDIYLKLVQLSFADEAADIQQSVKKELKKL